MKQHKRLLQIAWNILRILVPLALIGWLLWRVDWKAVLPLISHMPWWGLPAAALLFLLSHVVIAMRWNFLLRFQGIRLPFLRLLGLVFVGAFVSNFLPTTIGGDIIRMVGSARGQARRGVILASVVADRIYNLAGMFLLLPLAFTLKGITIPGLGTWMPVIGLAGWMGWSALRERFTRTWQEVRGWFLSPRCIVPALLLSWLVVGLGFASFWMITLALDIPVTYWQASASALLSYFVALIPLAVNGLGIQEGSLTILLGMQGASVEQATAAAFIIRIVTMAVSLIGGVRLLWGWQDLLQAGRKPAMIEEKAE